MVSSNIVSGQLSLKKARNRPNIVIYLMNRMGLGLFASVLPLLFFRFIISFFESPMSRDWQLHWAERMSALFVTSMLLSLIVAVIIGLVGYKRSTLQTYGRLVGRICTIGLTGISISIPYMTFLMAKGDFFVPTVMFAALAPIITFIVVSSATKDYLLRLRIWFDLKQ